jgi:hypothetical protein
MFTGKRYQIISHTLLKIKKNLLEALILNKQTLIYFWKRTKQITSPMLELEKIEDDLSCDPFQKY